MLALTIPERETIIRALDDPPLGLEELRAVLLREHVGRVRDGLVQPSPGGDVAESEALSCVATRRRYARGA